MNDLPQNELLSAYLDGELTAAEQAEMERLLAESPAARQLVEELRALRNMLRTLPQEKLTEDLSRQVLRVAERRMLTEEEPGAADDGPMTPVLLGRSLFRRFLNRRTMTWLTLTAAIALMIAISEWRQGVPPIAEGKKKVALVQPPPAGSLAPPPSSRFAGDAGLKIGPAVPAQQTMKLANAAESVAVVRCNISPEAARTRAFEKLLDANGVLWRQQPAPGRSAGELKERAARDAQPLPSDRSLFWPSIAAGEENFVEVEATAAQLDATLAGLKAQPSLFRSFSVKPNAEACRGARRAPAADEEKRASSQLTAAKSPLAAAAPLKAEQQVQQHLQPRPLVVPAARQRVLFVLHVVGGNPPPAEVRAPHEMKIDVAPPAEPAAPSDNAPKPQK